MRGTPPRKQSNGRGTTSPALSPLTPKRQRSNPVTRPTFPETANTVVEMYEQGSPLGFSIVIVDLQKRVADAVFNAFPITAQPREVEVRQGKIEDIDGVDCVVVSSNGFGLMNHGFDRSVAKLLGQQIKEKVVQRVIQDFHGEQPVGTCILVPTENSDIRFIAHAPTRRVNYSIRATDYVYLAVKAVIQTIVVHNRTHPRDKIRRVVMTGLGTFYGAVPAEESARQMCLAWLLARLPPKQVHEVTWDFARERSEMIGYGSFNNVLNEIIHFDDVQISASNRQALASKLANPGGAGNSSPRLVGQGSPGSPRQDLDDADDHFSGLPPAHRTDDNRDIVKVGSERVNKTTLQMPGRYKTRPGSNDGCLVM